MSTAIRWACIVGVFAIGVVCSSYSEAKSDDRAELGRAVAWWPGEVVAAIVVGALLWIEAGR